MIDSQRKTLAGARKIIKDALLLERGDVLAIFFDESTEMVSTILEAAAGELGVDVRTQRVPIEEQRAFRKQDGLGPGCATLLQSARAIITCLGAYGDCTEFRNELVHAGAQRNKRVGHMPGITLDILALIPTMKIDYQHIERQCDDLALALTLGESATIHTYRFSEEGTILDVCDLRIALGGQDRPAIVSPGRIPLGRWGNLPGGETFIAPIEYQTEGRFLLNGAFKGRVLSVEEFLVLHFSEGRLVDVRPRGDLADSFYSLFSLSRSTMDDSWQTLAELGIGVNQGIRKLTGVSLFDEKCLGTLHIALGNNVAFGGRSRSPVHEDLVTIKPSLWIDNRLVLDRGKFVFNAAEWRENISDFPPSEDINWQEHPTVMRGLTSGRNVNGRLVAEIGVGDGRLCAYTIGDARTTRLLSRVYAKIPRDKRIVVGELEKRLNRNGSAVRAPELHQALSILRKHRLVALGRD